MPICVVTKKNELLHPLQNMHLFAAILRPFGPERQNFNTWNLSSAWVWPVKFYLDPLINVCRSDSRKYKCIKPTYYAVIHWQRTTTHLNNGVHICGHDLLNFMSNFSVHFLQRRLEERLKNIPDNLSQYIFMSVAWKNFRRVTARRPDRQSLGYGMYCASIASRDKSRSGCVRWCYNIDEVAIEDRTHLKGTVVYPGIHCGCINLNKF